MTTKHTVWGRSAPSSVTRNEPFHHYQILPVAFERSCHFSCRVYWANSRSVLNFLETVPFRIKNRVCVPKEGVQNMSAEGSMVDFWRCRLLQSEDFLACDSMSLDKHSRQSFRSNARILTGMKQTRDAFRSQSLSKQGSWRWHRLSCN